MRCILSPLLSLLLVAGSTHALADAKLPPSFTREVLAGPEIPEPMDLAFAPDGAAWITARGGEVWRLDTTSRQKHKVGTLESDVAGDRGLHGIGRGGVGKAQRR